MTPPVRKLKQAIVRKLPIPGDLCYFEEENINAFHMSLTNNRLPISFIFALLISILQAHGQSASGFIPVNRLGVSYQKAIGVDLGFGAYNILFGRQKSSFFDVSLGTESIFARRFILVPKVNVDTGFPIWWLGGMTVGGGTDLGWQTDFSDGSLRLTPKVGVTAGSIIRLYYGYHLYHRKPVVDNLGRHRISLEVNIAAFHNLKIGF